jgi:malto-oligosyltrehalose trehalohydrolase/4-alpha-glucanotransferase
MTHHAMPFGAELRADGSVRFRLWAPSHSNVSVELDRGAALLAMPSVGDGWHELVTDRARAGTLYRFVLPDGSTVPDPASRFQPEDVHGPSEVIDPTKYDWREEKWLGRPWREAVVYELHVGTFSPEGTFAGALEKLDHLASLGITAIELMPIADFPGLRNWGYDGVSLYAPDSSYGRPDALRALIDAAHERRLMVFLDVVYNHFGPEGAYIHTIAPQTFTNRHQTPWGAAINTDSTDSATVREFFIHNASYWLEEFHLDGLRLDAVHAILDDGPKHLLEELAERVRSAFPERQIHLLLENEENDARLLARNTDGQPRWYSAQWNDDVHHVLHVAATGEGHGYYGDYHDDGTKLGRALAQGFAFQGDLMPYRGRPRGQPSAGLPPPAFVAFIQNHDQVGNRAFGERLVSLAPLEVVRAVAAVYLLLPQIPMLFMGEEWGATQPFPFFCDFEPHLAEAVRKGRREEFARFPEFQDPQRREHIPDATAIETFVAAKLDWEDLTREPHANWCEWYRRALRVRREEITPRLERLRRGGDFRVIGPGAVAVTWSPAEGDGEQLLLEANLSGASVDGFSARIGRILWQEGHVEAEAHGRLGAYSVRWSVAAPSTERAAQPGASSALGELAERMGILSEYRDARGKIVRTTEETQRKLLGAMGLEVQNESEAAAALDALERESWRQPLPSVRVITAGRELPTLDIVVAAGLDKLNWRLCLEDGTEQHAIVAVDGLELLDSRCVDGQQLERRRLVFEGDLPWGYHQLAVEPGGQTTLVVTPGNCWLPPELRNGARLWGLAAQLYLLRSSENWGIGDFGDLLRLVRLGASNGADVIGLNPLHAMFEDAPEHASPYSPASRLLLNVLNIDVEAVPELKTSPEARRLMESPEFQERLNACRASRLVDYGTVAELKMKALRAIFDSCHADASPRWESFQAFRRERGAEFEQSCLFLTLREHFARLGADHADWHAWPSEYQSHDSPAVASFARQHAQEIELMAWLQWIADEQLGAAARAAGEHEMRIGLYRDLAVGADRSGAETWANPTTVVSGAQVGAPPDIFNPAGQDWGLPPFNPHALRAEDYRSFIQLIRANMRFAGGLRIDHAMALQQLYWVPQGGTPREGAYVRYPLEDLVGILALESHRQRCLVVGEDLGTVPEGFREKMAAANILSYRVLFFEQDFATGEFVGPRNYPFPALAVVGSHDLPTLRGWWRGRDIDLKERLGLFPDPGEAARQRSARDRDKQELVKALRREKLLAGEGEPDFSTLVRAVHAFLARTNSALVMAQLDDITDETEPVNIPATSDEHPNWRRRLSLTLDELAGSLRLSDLAAIFAAERAHS